MLFFKFAPLFLYFPLKVLHRHSDQSLFSKDSLSLLYMLHTVLGAGNAAINSVQWTQTLVSTVRFFYSLNQIHLSLNILIMIQNIRVWAESMGSGQTNLSMRQKLVTAACVFMDMRVLLSLRIPICRTEITIPPSP